MRRFNLFILAFLGLSFSVMSGEQSKEIIHDYAVIIKVQVDRSLIIEEHIKVYADNVQINRGIYRDIPVVKKTGWGLVRKYDLEILDIRRDGLEEGYHFQRENSYYRLYIGKSDTTLEPGMYNYTIKYRMGETLESVSNKTVLYWNVIGDQWDSPIQHASLKLILPRGAGDAVDFHKAWQGKRGDVHSAYTFTQSEDILYFDLNQPLKAGEGWTVKVFWEKGYVDTATPKEIRNKFILDNRGLFIILSGIILVLIYYLITWFYLGRDPRKGSIMTYFEPPRGLSPGEMRYIQNMAYDKKVFSAVIINMAVKGHILIEEKEDKYTLTRVGENTKNLSPEEVRVSKELFEEDDKIKVDNINHDTFKEAISVCKDSLNTRFLKTYFITNKYIFVTGLLASILVMLAGFISNKSDFVMIFMMVWLSFWNVGVFFLLKTVVTVWKKALSSRKHKGALSLGAMFMTVFSSFFVGADILAFWFMMKSSPGVIWMIILAAAAVIMNYVFFHLLKAPTLAGRKLMDKIEGFKRYLDVAEKDKMGYFNPPEKTVATFEQFLPYALAFDMEKNWAGYFHDVLIAAQTDQSYSPGWYHGSSFSSMSAGDFSSSLSSGLSSALSSASVSPSSGGSSGGGFSGGGGGGGGGGGW